MGLALCLLCGCGDDQARHERAIPWSLGGTWVIADLHTHTRYSDGVLSPGELVSRAVINGCGALAITDHSDASAKSASAEFLDEMAALRSKLPDVVLLAGLEWNVPPYAGREHVNLIVDPQVERVLLPQFKAMFDPSAAQSAEPGLAWLASAAKDPVQRVLIYNHPLRHVTSSAARVEQDLAAWHAAGGILVGFEGGPGHQRGSTAASYPKERPAQDRWDPVAAQVGGVWDRLLARGIDIWGALANSDFHNEGLDEEPCKFSQTFLQVPERSPKGVLQAIRAGTFWGAHDRFLRHLAFTVNAPGLTVPAAPGELIRYRAGADATARVMLERSTSAAHRPLTVELIGNCRDGHVESMAITLLDPAKSDAQFQLTRLAAGEDGATCYVRARVTSAADNGENVLAYTNQIRIRLK